MANNYILVCNAGSATLKFKLYDAGTLGRPRMYGEVERIGLPKSFIEVNGWKFFHAVPDHSAAIRLVLSKIGQLKQGITAIGHRVVHGGFRFGQPIVITNNTIRQIHKFNQLAPLHNPKNIEVIRECMQQSPHAKNIAVFDTGIFSTIPEEYSHYALPQALTKKLGIRKYGFHGISHGYAAAQASRKLKKPMSRLNLVTIHLGNGCSLTAFKNGRAVDSSLGFTPTAGLVMGTRSGDLDPIIPLYIQKKLHMSPEGVEKILNEESGLLGLSGFTSDMREILKAAGYPVTSYIGRKSFTTSQRKNARLALHVFIARLRLFVSAYAGMLGKVHALVFTGSMGERSAVIRRLTVKNLPELRHVPVLVVKADEELAIAQAVKNIV